MVSEYRRRLYDRADREHNTMRKNLAERQAAMKKKLLAARETFRNCAFREECCQEDPELDPEFCSRCSATALQQRLRRSRSSSD